MATGGVCEHDRDRGGASSPVVDGQFDDAIEPPSKIWQCPQFASEGSPVIGPTAATPLVPRLVADTASTIPASSLPYSWKMIPENRRIVSPRSTLSPVQMDHIVVHLTHHHSESPGLTGGCSNSRNCPQPPTFVAFPQIPSVPEWQVPMSHNFTPTPNNRDSSCEDSSRESLTKCVQRRKLPPANDELESAKVQVQFLHELPFPKVKEDSAKAFLMEDSELTDADVLFGRGGMTNAHPGNITFRALVEENRLCYGLAKKYEKSQIAISIVQRMRKNHGRFLKKDEKTDRWYEVGDENARDKTSQTLREGLAKRYRAGLMAASGDKGRVSGRAESDQSDHRGRKRTVESSQKDSGVASVAKKAHVDDSKEND